MRARLLFGTRWRMASGELPTVPETPQYPRKDPAKTPHEPAGGLAAALRTFPLVRARLRTSANGAEPSRTGPRGYTLGYIPKIISRLEGGTQDQLLAGPTDTRCVS